MAVERARGKKSDPEIVERLLNDSAAIGVPSGALEMLNEAVTTGLLSGKEYDQLKRIHHTWAEVSLGERIVLIRTLLEIAGKPHSGMRILQ